MKKNSYEHYFRNAREEKFDNEINTAIYADGNRVEMALYLQNQAIINMLRHLEDEVADIRKQLAETNDEKEPEPAEKKSGKEIVFYCKGHEQAVEAYNDIEDAMTSWGCVTLKDLYEVFGIPGEPKDNLVWRWMNGIEVKDSSVVFPTMPDRSVKE